MLKNSSEMDQLTILRILITPKIGIFKNCVTPPLGFFFWGGGEQYVHITPLQISNQFFVSWMLMLKF